MDLATAHDVKHSWELQFGGNPGDPVDEHVCTVCELERTVYYLSDGTCEFVYRNLYGVRIVGDATEECTPGCFPHSIPEHE